MAKNHTISVVLSEPEKARVQRLKAALEKRTRICWPITQVMRFALETLAAKEKIK